MDFFTFIIIAAFIYSIFSKKDKPPQRGQRGSQGPRPQTGTPAPRKKRESIFESLERQLRESAEQLERELQSGRAAPPKPTTVETYRRKKEYRPSSTPRSARSPIPEGAWGQEGRSRYDKYPSTQGTQGLEGTPGREGLGGQEGTWGTEGIWGTEGAYYAQKEAGRASAIEQSEIGLASPIYGSQKRRTGTFVFSPSQVVQGIIWSEILKEPRAKKTFARSKGSLM
ncbi:MAG TPA: hypothetical protein GXX46_02365 [Peptococcaceae bacterium]|nr:hypothetical protein [Peptococcaceae bacterium]